MNKAEDVPHTVFGIVYVFIISRKSECCIPALVILGVTPVVERKLPIAWQGVGTFTRGTSTHQVSSPTLMNFAFSDSDP